MYLTGDDEALGCVILSIVTMLPKTIKDLLISERSGGFKCL